jgi:hypothetical protein
MVVCPFFSPSFVVVVDVVLLFLPKVHNDGRPSITSHGRKATIQDFYGVWNFDFQKTSFNVVCSYFNFQPPTTKETVLMFVTTFTNFSLFVVLSKLNFSCYIAVS